MIPMEDFPSSSNPTQTHRTLRFALFLVIVLYFVLNFGYLLNQNSLQKTHKFIIPKNLSTTYLINTPTCRIRDYPLFDREILELNIFINRSGTEIECSEHTPPFRIYRVNFTWIQIDYPPRERITDSGWICYAQEIYRNPSNDGGKLGDKIGPLGSLENFAHNLTWDALEEDPVEGRWDAVSVYCEMFGNSSVNYTRIVLLVQNYKPKNPDIQESSKPKKFKHPHKTNKTYKPPNVILLGLDSVSRLNFHRHMIQTGFFLETHEFIPFLGHHKVGENTFPNLIPILSGKRSDEVANDTTDKDPDFRLDGLRTVFDDFSEMGYITTFVEDMPWWGIFSWHGGFIKRPTDYYIRPATFETYKEMYSTHTCYQDKIEILIYWDFFLDLWKSFDLHHISPHFSFAHLASLTHDYINHVGYADAPYHHFLSQLFAQGSHTDSVIILYSDHALRFGDILKTTSGTYESRLPFLFVYIPDSLKLDGKDASEIRQIMRRNSRRLTSQFDLYATMLHVLYGKTPNEERWGRSLLREIPYNRTCADAGIPPEFCLCNNLVPIPVTPEIHAISQFILTSHINRILSKDYAEKCLQLNLTSTNRAFSAENLQHRGNEKYRVVHFDTAPNDAAFEATVGVSENGGVAKVIMVTRLDSYSRQSECVRTELRVVQFCYCRDVYAKDSKST